MNNLETITEELLQGKRETITDEEALYLTRLSKEAILDLLAAANRLRRKFKGSEVFTCVILNAKSGKCSQNCAFCAQSKYHQTGVKIYSLLPRDQLIEKAYIAQENGATNYSMVTSGHMLTTEELDQVCEATQTIREQTDLTVCASLGELTSPMARQLKQSGITNYHHNLETARSFFPNICTTHDYEEDIQTICEAAASGMRVCSGGIMGLGETWEQRIELSATLRDLAVDSIPLNFLNPIPGTRLEKKAPLLPLEALQCIALFRMMNPERDITICGGREPALQDFQSWVFLSGANGLMVGNYLTTQGRNIEMDQAMIAALGLTVQ